MFFIKKLKNNQFSIPKNLSLDIRIFSSILGSFLVIIILNKYVFISNSPLINYRSLTQLSKKILNFKFKNENKDKITTNNLAKKNYLPTIKLEKIISPTRKLESIKPTTKNRILTKIKKYPTAYQTKKPNPTKKISKSSTNCPKTSHQNYSAIKVISSPTNKPAKNHPDLNLKIRGFKKTKAELKLIDLGGDTDLKAPKLTTLIKNNSQPRITQAYQVYDWNWDNNTRGALLNQPYSVTLISLKTNFGQIIQVPKSGYDIGSGFQVMVLYADSDSITLKYTREDNVVSGYTIHILDLCLDPNLLALYQKLNNQGRQSLPALHPQELIGTAKNNSVKIAIRDTGQFMDPRSKKDWW